MANGLPTESIGYYTRLEKRILVELNPNILVWTAIIMSTVYCLLTSQVLVKAYEQPTKEHPNYRASVDLLDQWFVLG